MGSDPIPAKDTEALRTRLEALAIRYHKVQEGEYGCDGATCPGVKRLLAFAESAVAAADALSAPPQPIGAGVWQRLTDLEKRGVQRNFAPTSGVTVDWRDFQDLMRAARGVSAPPPGTRVAGVITIAADGSEQWIPAMVGARLDAGAATGHSGPARWRCRRCGNARRRSECLRCGNLEPVTDEPPMPGAVR
jgi:hypothetical protein